MTAVERFLLKVKRADTPVYAFLKRAARAVLSFSLPAPRAVAPMLRLLYHFHFFLLGSFRRLVGALYVSPLFRSRCSSVGARLQISQMPEIYGPVVLYLGDDVHISGKLRVRGGRVYDQPELRLGHRVFLGHNVTFSVAQRIEVEDDVLIAGGCYITDNSGHPKDAERRAAGETSDLQAVRPIRICRKAWLGRGCIILPGVTIGEGAIVGAGSVVTKDVPAFGVCAGNPARLVQPRSE